MEADACIHEVLTENQQFSAENQDFPKFAQVVEGALSDCVLLKDLEQSRPDMEQAVDTFQWRRPHKDRQRWRNRRTETRDTDLCHSPTDFMKFMFGWSCSLLLLATLLLPAQGSITQGHIEAAASPQNHHFVSCSLSP